jgi:hypothetical protein
MISGCRLNPYPIKIPISGYNIRLDMTSAIIILGCNYSSKISDFVFKLP